MSILQPNVFMLTQIFKLYFYNCIQRFSNCVPRAYLKSSTKHVEVFFRDHHIFETKIEKFDQIQNRETFSWPADNNLIYNLAHYEKWWGILGLVATFCLSGVTIADKQRDAIQQLQMLFLKAQQGRLQRMKLATTYETHIIKGFVD